jgi:hypothetical protein
VIADFVQVIAVEIAAITCAAAPQVTTQFYQSRLTAGTFSGISLRSQRFCG